AAPMKPGQNEFRENGPPIRALDGWQIPMDKARRPPARAAGQGCVARILQVASRAVANSELRARRRANGPRDQGKRTEAGARGQGPAEGAGARDGAADPRDGNDRRNRSSEGATLRESTR